MTEEQIARSASLLMMASPGAPVPSPGTAVHGRTEARLGVTIAHQR
jgi:hypothetical protein